MEAVAYVGRDAVDEIGEAPQAGLTACESPSREISRGETGLRIACWTYATASM
jgi:hypothetical protein